MGTRKHIVTKALGLFICKSYKAATIADLEVATGMTKGAFYHYFKSKEELFIEVIDNVPPSARLVLVSAISVPTVKSAATSPAPL